MAIRKTYTSGFENDTTKNLHSGVLKMHYSLQDTLLNTKQILRPFSTDIHCHFMPLSEKPGLEDRKNLRKKLIQQIQNHKGLNAGKDFPWEKLLVTGQKPQCPWASISISHCEGLGAFLFRFDKKIIGFDMEKTRRIKTRILLRVSSDEELKKAPSPALLWTAKEASLKCLSNDKENLLLSDCVISNWKADSKKECYFFECHLKNHGKKARGRAGFAGDLSLAYAEL